MDPSREAVLLDFGLKDTTRPKIGQWLKWRTPAGRIVVTSTTYTRPIEEWYATSRAWLEREFAPDFRVDD